MIRFAAMLFAGIFVVFLNQIALAVENNVSPGMRIEDAFYVAESCVIQASSFKHPRETKIKELRPNDTLEFAGISDALRLNALRRYIIRNRQIGVQSIWGVRLSESIAQPYIIDRGALNDIDKSWTIGKLALAISEKAGLPFIAPKSVSKLIANCRNKLNPSPRGARAVIQPPLVTRIKDDIADLTGFTNCLVEQKGGLYVFRDAAVIDPEGNTFSYHVDDVASFDAIVRKGSFIDLIRHVSVEARVDFSSYLTATALVVNAIRDLSSVRCDSISFRLSKPCNDGGEIRESTTLSDLGIRLSDFRSRLRPSGNALKRMQLKRKSDPIDIPDLSQLAITEFDPLWKVIQVVESDLEKKEIRGK